jgi:hypothetical protein
MLYNDLMNKTLMKTYNLQVTEEQLKVISSACELLSRIQGGQIREAFEHLPLKKGVDWDAYHEIQDEVTKRMPEILEDGIDGWSSSFGVGSPKLPDSHDIAWDLYTTTRHQLSWEYAIEQGWVEDFNSPRDWSKMLGVSYDTPMKFSKEPLAKLERVS